MVRQPTISFLYALLTVCDLIATSDMGYAEQRIGSERIKGAYAWRSLLKCVSSLHHVGLH